MNEMRRHDYLKRVSHTSKFRYPFKSAISINIETESRLDFLLKQFSNQLLSKSADLYRYGCITRNCKMKK